MLYWCGWIVSYLGTFDVSTGICLVSCLSWFRRKIIHFSLGVRGILLLGDAETEGSKFSPLCVLNVFFFFLNDESRCISPTPGLVIITLVGTDAE